MNVPGELRYSKDHEWVRVSDGNSATVGITDYAQDALGDVVFVDLPDVGTSISVGDSIGEIESTKSVSDVYSPLSGTVTATNAELQDAPEKVNSDPYGEGWMFMMEIADAGGLDELMDAAAYAEFTEG
ncbi:MAG: glycine cleavage system protein GcvH [Acidimicrobiales bacterium]|nr:glycine cleavage system protein GcvH [Acidimicrobiales bacterium]